MILIGRSPHSILLPTSILCCLLLLLPGIAVAAPKGPSAHSPANQDSDPLVARLRRHVRVLAGDIGERHIFHRDSLARAAKYIEGYWNGLGLRVLHQPVALGSRRSDNLQVRLAPESDKRPFILVGAHYDTVKGSPGADDNASGVAVLLEMTRLLQQVSPPPSVRLVSFTNEEKILLTGHNGSSAFAAEMRRNNEPLQLMLSLDTLGYYSFTPNSQKYPVPVNKARPREARFLGVITRIQDEGILDRFCGLANQSAHLEVECMATYEEVDGVGWSDHAAFWGQGYPALMVTDTAMFRNPHYHRPSDTPSTLNYDRLADTVTMLVHVVTALASISH